MLGLAEMEVLIFDMFKHRDTVEAWMDRYRIATGMKSPPDMRGRITKSAATVSSGMRAKPAQKSERICSAPANFRLF